MPTSYFTVFIFSSCFLDGQYVSDFFFIFALHFVWEERNICISSPNVGVLFQGFNPSDRYFAA